MKMKKINQLFILALATMGTLCDKDFKPESSSKEPSFPDFSKKTKDRLPEFFPRFSYTDHSSKYDYDSTYNSKTKRPNYDSDDNYGPASKKSNKDSLVKNIFIARNLGELNSEGNALISLEEAVKNRFLKLNPEISEGQIKTIYVYKASRQATIVFDNDKCINDLDSIDVTYTVCETTPKTTPKISLEDVVRNIDLDNICCKKQDFKEFILRAATINNNNLDIDSIDLDYDELYFTYARILPRFLDNEKNRYSGEVRLKYRFYDLEKALDILNINNKDHPDININYIDEITLGKIRKIYYALARKHHSDKTQGSDEKMKELNWAWAGIQAYYLLSKNR